MDDAVILSAVRLPIGRFLGGLSPLPATQLGAQAIRAAVDRAGLDPGQIDEVLMGNVVQAGEGQAPARQAALRAGLPDSVPATTVNKVCGSGLKTVMLAASAIRAGDGDLFVAGGMESMSNAPYLLPGARQGYRMGNREVLDAVIHDGLWCACGDEHMGMCAERIAECYGVTREEQDAFALESQRKALAAVRSGAFRDEIVPVEVLGPKGTTTVAEDETPRPDTSA